MKFFSIKVLFLTSLLWIFSENVQGQVGNTAVSNSNHIVLSQSASEASTDLSIQLFCKKKVPLNAVLITIEDFENKNTVIKVVSDQRGTAEFKYPQKIRGTSQLKVKVGDFEKIIFTTEEIMKVNLSEKTCTYLRHQKKAVTPKK